MFRIASVVLFTVAVVCSCRLARGAKPAIDKLAPRLIAKGKNYFVHALPQDGRPYSFNADLPLHKAAPRPRLNHYTTHKLVHTSRDDGRMTVLIESFYRPRSSFRRLGVELDIHAKIPYRESIHRIAGIATVEDRLFVLRYNREESGYLRSPRWHVAWRVQEKTEYHTLFVFDLNRGKRLSAVTIKGKKPEFILIDMLEARQIKVAGNTVQVLGRRFGLDGKELGPPR